MVKSESVAEKAQSTEKKSLNDRLAGGALKFGLNDRIGFVKDLFDGSAEDFNRVVSQLNTLGSLGEAQDFLTHILHRNTAGQITRKPQSALWRR